MKSGNFLNLRRTYIIYHFCLIFCATSALEISLNFIGKNSDVQDQRSVSLWIFYFSERDCAGRRACPADMARALLESLTDLRGCHVCRKTTALKFEC